jgi:predicted RND superfamily exporter protein
MEYANKIEIVHELTRLVDELAELRGVNRCVSIVNIIQKLNFLEKVLLDEDSNHEAAIKELTAEIDKLRAEVHKEECSDA